MPGALRQGFALVGDAGQQEREPRDLFGQLWHGTLAWSNKHTRWLSKLVRSVWPGAVTVFRIMPFGVCLGAVERPPPTRRCDLIWRV